MKKSGALTLDIRPSLLGQGLVTMLACLAFLVIFYLQPSILLFGVMALAIAGLWAWRIARLNKPRWRRVVVSHTGDQVTLTGKGKLRRSGHLDKAMLNTGLLAGFSVSTEQGRQQVWLFPDNVDGDGFRRLRELMSRPKAD
jgi:hypothetical protein